MGEDWEKIFFKNLFFKSKLFGLNLMILYNLVQEIRNRNIKMNCLSGIKFSFHFKAKQNFINKQYGNDIELVSAGSQQLKLDGIKIITKANNCSLKDALKIR